jgi:hypothetical protein
MQLLLLMLMPFISFSQVIYSESAEGTTLFASKLSGATVAKQTTTVYGITLSKDKHYSGYQSARFELRDTDPMNNSGTRAEIVFPTLTSLNRWYSYALLFDSANYKKDASDEVITQWHQGGGKTPALCLRTKNDRLYLRIMGNIWIDLGLLDKGKWHAYVMHIKHSSGSGGLVEIWRDGIKILGRTGQNMYRVSGDIKMPNLKIGIYKSAWNDNATTQTNKRVLFFDEIKMGNEKATLAEMTPTR